MTPPFQRYPLILRILLMFSMFLFNAGIVSIVALYAAEKIFHLESTANIMSGAFTGTNDMNAFLFYQGLGSLGGFALTALMFSVLEAGEFKNHLRLTVFPTAKLIALAIIAVLVAQFFIDFLVEVNQKIPLPPSLQFLHQLQKQTEDLSNAMMSFKDVGHLVLVSLVVGLIPAMGEELFFRGLLLGDLLKSKISPLIAIPVTGLVFAISHFEYDNVLAIWALGSFLGYLYYVSGSLWLPIAAHFTNNFMAVLLKYLYNLGMISDDLANAKTPIYATLISMAVFGLFIFLFNKWKNPATFVELPETESINQNPTS